MRTTTRRSSATRRTGRRPEVAALAAVAVAALLAGCGGSGGGTPTTSTSATTAPGGSGSPTATAPSASPSPSGATATGEPAPTSTKEVTDPAGPTAPAAVLVTIRTADRGTYDRVVLEFDRPFGGYTVKYVDQLTEDPTGETIDVAGGAVLAVVVQGATLNNSFQTGGDVPLATYGGPRQVSPNLPAVKQVREAGDFEAVLSFGIGTAAETGFKVMKLADPARLVVDVAH